MAKSPGDHPDSGFVLGEWEVAPVRNEIRRRGEVRRLDHITMRLLVDLARQYPRCVPRQELLGRVWGSGLHSDEVLTVAVSSLRKTLGDDAQSPQYIKTVPRLGYQLVTPPARRTPPGAWARLAERLGLRFAAALAVLALFLLLMLTQVLVELALLWTPRT